MEDTMTIRSKQLHSLLLVALTAILYGCGGGGSSSVGSVVAAPPSGKLAQGPVRGAVVFADRAVGGTRFVKDADEISAITDANGNYRLPSVPNYSYVLVSKGGVDTLTGKPAIQMLAQPGSVNITILTTLLTLDSTGTTKLSEKLQALQPTKAPLDFDISTASTPATLLLAKSVEVAVESISTTVVTNATAKGYTISDQQLADIQFQALQQIARGFSTTTANLATPAGLNLALTAAVKAGITEINKAANIEISSAAAASIADNAVLAAATILATTPSSTVAMSVSSVQSEVALASASPATFTAAFSNAASAIFAAVSSLTTTSASTPFPYGPADIVVFYINTFPGVLTGSAGTGSSGGGTGVGF
jgi:hypothetical protein